MNATRATTSTPARQAFFRRRKSCPFSVPGAPKIDYKDVKLLQRFVSERGKIVPVAGWRGRRQSEQQQCPWQSREAGAFSGHFFLEVLDYACPLRRRRRPALRYRNGR